MKSSILQISTKYQVAQTTLVLAATMVLPFLVHLLPNINGNLAGAVLLPVFVAPLVAAYLFKKHVALFAGVVAPLLNYLLIGQPRPDVVISLSIEIALFVSLLLVFKNIRVLEYLAAPAAYLLASVLVVAGIALTGTLASPVAYWISTTTAALPGIVLIGVFSILFSIYKK